MMTLNCPVAVASCAYVLSLKNCENPFFAGISDLIDIVTGDKQKKYMTCFKAGHQLV